MKLPIFSLLSARRAFAAGFVLLFGLARPAPVMAQEKGVMPPQKLWFSLGYSTLDEAPPDWNWLREQCRNGQFVRGLKLRRGHQGALIVPVFDDGHVFYSTSVAPFTGRNPRAAAEEAALNDLLQAARKRGIAVYLAFDVLGWQKTPRAGWKSSDSKGIFDAAPEGEELTKELEAPAVGTRFASPGAAAVEKSLHNLVSECARRFPLAAGAVLDVHLSRGEIMGFGAASRLAARRELGFDPISLPIQGTADEKWGETSKNGSPGAPRLWRI